MKKVLKTILMAIVYFLLIFLPMFPGFLSPTAWFFYPVLSAFLAASPFLWGGAHWRKFGSVALFPLVWYVLMVLMGELSFPERIIAPLVVIAAAEIVRRIMGYNSQMGLRVSYAVAALAPVSQHLIIFTRTAYYYQGAVEEMGSEAYAQAITGYAKPGWFLLLVVLTFVVGFLGAVVSEKIFKNKVMITD